MNNNILLNKQDQSMLGRKKENHDVPKASTKPTQLIQKYFKIIKLIHESCTILF
jgi:hypothetical protein